MRPELEQRGAGETLSSGSHMFIIYVYEAEGLTETDGGRVEAGTGNTGGQHKATCKSYVINTYYSMFTVTASLGTSPRGSSVSSFGLQHFLHTKNFILISF